MALRRLLSGWLIAMAALARSVAQALERASEDRSATPDHVMAALAERYPGAPAHWLAHVAERTSQLAEAGVAPLSLDSDPAAWPPARPDGLAPPSTPATEPEPAPRDPGRPGPRRDAPVPTLAALRDRSSEVWRRPDTERPRRPRPVFAAVQPGTTPEGARFATLETSAPPRRPRSPLTFVGSPIQAPNASESSTPGADARTARASQTEATWSEASPPPLATPDTIKAWHDAQRSTARPMIDQAFTQTRPTEDRPEAPFVRAGATSAVRGRRSWFFSKSALGRLGRSLELSTALGRRPGSDRMDAGGATASDPATASRAAVSFSTSDLQTAAPDRVWQTFTPPASRRSIFRALASLRAKPRPRTDPLQAAEPTVAGTATTTIDRPAPRSGREHPALTFTPSRERPSARITPAFSPIERDAPQSSAERREPRRAAHRAVRQAASVPTSAGETQVQGKRPTFTAFPRTASRPVPRGFLVSPPDDRWPALPPTTLASPQGVEASAPRWDELAREQEEGRWSV